MKIKFLILSVASCIVLASCGGSDTPEAVTKGFVEALSKKDFDAAKGYCTKGSATILDGIKGLAAMAPETKLSKSEVTCKTEGDKSTCEFCCAEGKDKETYNLVKEDGKWKVEYIKSGMNNVKEGMQEGMEDLKEGVEALKDVVDTLNAVAE